MSKRPPLGAARALTAGLLAAASTAAVVAPTTAKAQAADQAVAALVKQAAFWRERGRKDLAGQALQKALAADPKNADALAALARYAIQDGDRAGGQRWTERLRAAAPNDPRLADLSKGVAPAPTTVAAGSGVDGATADAVAEARRLSRAGDNSGAAKAYKRAFPSGAPPAQYEQEYYQTLSGVSAYAAEGRRGLERLAQARPNDAGAQLAYAQALTYAEATRREGVARLERLAKAGGPTAAQARASWRQALLWLGATPRDAGLYEAFLATGADPEIKAKIDGAREAAQRAQASAAPVDRGAPLRAEGYAALEKGDLAAAERAFQSALRTRTSDADALGGLGLIRLRSENFAEAKTYLQRAIRAAPKARSRWSDALASAEFFSDLRAGQAAAAQGDLARADKLIRPLARGTAKDRALAQQLLADIALRQGRNAEAEGLYREVLRAQPAQADARNGLIEALLRQNRYAEAEGLAAQAEAQIVAAGGSAALNATRGRIEYGRAGQLLAAGDYSGAYAAYEAALAASPTDPWIRFDFARFLAAQGQGPAAEGLMAPLSQSSQPAALQAAALFAQQQGRTAEAYALVSRIPQQARTTQIAALADQLYIDQTIEQARNLRIAGRNMEALSALRALTGRPGLSVGAQGAIAAALYDLGERQQALSLAQQVVMTGATGADPAAYEGYVSVLAKAGRDAEAAALVRQAAASPTADTPTGRQSMAGLAATLGAERADRLRLGGDLAGAFDVLSQSFALAPNNPRLLSTLGRVYQAGGLTAQAGQVYEALLQQRPGDADALSGLTEAALAGNDLARARTFLAQAIAAAPTKADLYLLAARIERASGDNAAALRALETARSLRTQEDAGAALPRALPVSPVYPSQTTPPGVLGPNPFVRGGSAVFQTPFEPTTGLPTPVAAPAAWTPPNHLLTQPVAWNPAEAWPATPVAASAAWGATDALASEPLTLRTLDGGQVYAPQAAYPAPAGDPGFGFVETAQTQPQAVWDADQPLAARRYAQAAPTQPYYAPPYAQAPAPQLQAPQPTYPTGAAPAQGQTQAPAYYPAPTYPYAAPSSPAQTYTAPGYPAPVPPAPTYAAPSYPYAAQPAAPAPAYRAPQAQAPVYPTAPAYTAPSYAAPAPAYTPPVYAAPAPTTPSYGPQLPTNAYRPTPPPGGYAPLTTPASPLQPRPAKDGVLQAIDRQIADISDEIGPRLDGGLDFRSRTGEAGLSQLNELSAKATASISPFGRGRLSAGLNAVTLDAGDASDDSLQKFGTNPLAVARAEVSNQTAALRAPNPQTASGLAAEVAYEVAGVRADIGVTPVGFANKPEVTAGLSVEPQLNGLRPKVWLERRAVTDSVTSYAGARDPSTGRRWGQVMRSTAGAGLAYEQGSVGFYADASASKYDGRSTRENKSFQVNLGGYVRPYQSETAQVQLGINVNHQGYDNNQNNFSLGHGGYFSPQRFTAIAFPMSFRREGPRWRVDMRLTPGYQTYTQEAAPFFPTDPTLQGAQNAIAARDADVDRGFVGSSRSGFGVNARGAIDYRFTPNTTFGGALSFDNFGQYNETVVALKLRQTFGGRR